MENPLQICLSVELHIFEYNRGGRLAGMNLTLGSLQCFAIGMVVFGFIGFLQGWKRALVTMSLTLLTVLFLSSGGANLIAEFIFVRIPLVIGTLTNGALGAKSTPPPPSSTQVLFTSIITLEVVYILGYFIGRSVFKAEKAGGYLFYTSTSGQFMGLVLGLVTGYVIVNYVSKLFAANPSITVGVATPSSTTINNAIVILVVVAVVALILSLLMARLGKK